LNIYGHGSVSHPSSIFLENEDGGILSSLPKGPVDKETFLKLCDERRKFPVLYKAEFQVENIYFALSIWKPGNYYWF
jgi:hypothetical protein